MIRLHLLAAVVIGCVAMTSHLARSAAAAVVAGEKYELGFAYTSAYALWPGTEPNRNYAPFGVGHASTTSAFPVPSLSVPFPSVAPISGSESLTTAMYRTPHGDRLDSEFQAPIPYFYGEEIIEVSLLEGEGPAESTTEQRSMLQFDADGKAVLKFKYRAELASPDSATEFPEFAEAVTVASIQQDYPEFVPPEGYDENTRIFDAPVHQDQGVWATFALSFIDNFNFGEDETRTSRIAAYGTYNPLDGTWEDEINSFDYVELITDGQVHSVEIQLNVLTPELRQFVDFGELFDPMHPDYIDNHDTAESLFIRMWGSTGRTVVFDNFELCPLSGCGVTQLVGDFNGDMKVDAADYTVWRDNLGTNFDLNGNGDETGGSAGVVDMADYAAWKANFGNSSGAGSGAVAQVPEPASIASLMLLPGLGILRRRGMRWS